MEVIDKAPNYPNSNYPGAGARLAPAWQAAWRRMADGAWHSSVELIEVMSAAGPIAVVTARNVLREARRGKLIESRRTCREDGGHGPTEYRRKVAS